MASIATSSLEIPDVPKTQIKVLGKRARAAGQSVGEYVRTLIAAEVLAEKSFDELLAPVRKGFEKVSDEELTDLVKQARTAYHARRKRSR